MSSSDAYSDSEGDDGGLSPLRNDDGDAGMEDSGRLRLRPDIALDGEDYEGKRVSRRTAFDEEFGLDESFEGDFFEGAPGASRRPGDAAGSGSSDEGEKSNGDRRLLGAQDEELDALNAEYEKLREEEEQGLEILRAQDTGDQRKAEAVRNQKDLWDGSLEFRIGLQKLLEKGNRLPRKVVRDVMTQENDQIKEGFSRLTESAVRALNSLMDLETALIANNSAISESFSSRPNPSGDGEEASPVDESETVADKSWKSINDLHGRLVPYRDTALDRWQRKTQIYSGAIAKVKLRAFNQSVSQQVASAMRDSTRAISRTRLKRGSVHVLGEPSEEPAKRPLDNDQVSNAEASSGADRGLVDEGDPETFDDLEFYHQLLSEVVELADPSAAGRMHASARYQNKRRKVVDRRASKGRKLRYNVKEQLLNFMAPKPMVLPPMAEKLFSNLLGQKRAPSRIATA